MSRRKVVLPGGAKRDAFNWFIGNYFGYHEFEPTTNEFGVLDTFIDQPTMDQKLADFVADQANIEQQYSDFFDDFIDEEFRERDVDNNAGVQSLIKVMVDELNAVRANAGLPNLNLGQVTAAVRSNAKKP
jgi:hypothetical protein